jgi:hypothetical protein
MIDRAGAFLRPLCLCSALKVRGAPPNGRSQRAIPDSMFAYVLVPSSDVRPTAAVPVQLKEYRAPRCLFGAEEPRNGIANMLRAVATGHAAHKMCTSRACASPVVTTDDTMHSSVRCEFLLEEVPVPSTQVAEQVSRQFTASPSRV